MELFDIGVNLSNRQFNSYHSELLGNAYDNNVSGIISISNSRREWDMNLDLIRQYDRNSIRIFTTVGFHPHISKNVKNFQYRDLIDYASKKEVVAIGECGLDYDRMFSPKETQITVFKRQIEIASRVNKPLYIHERLAVNDMIQILSDSKQKFENLKFVIHCFTGNKDTLQKYLDLGCYIGITGWICDLRRNRDLSEAVKILPLNRMMVESDSPWLMPYEYKKKWDAIVNEPSSLEYIIKDLSKYTGHSIKDIEFQTMKNASRFI